MPQLVDNSKTNLNSFVLKLKNNTLVSQNVVLFDLIGTYNATNALVTDIDYTWDLTTGLANAVTNNYSTLVILAQITAGGPFSTFIYTNPSGTFTTIAQVLIGLNSFGLSTFTLVSGNTITTDVTTNNVVYSSISLTGLFTSVQFQGGDTYVSTGSVIYNTDFIKDLTQGTITLINQSNPFWINAGNQTDGPYNRSGIWSRASPQNPSSELGFYANINVASPTNVYMGFGFGADNCIININNVNIINITGGNAPVVDPGTLAYNIFHQTSGLSGYGSAQGNWFIIPVTLAAGNNLIQMTSNYFGTGPDGSEPAGIGMEIYENTAAQIAAATDYSTLNVLFKSSNYAPSIMF